MFYIPRELQASQFGLLNRNEYKRNSRVSCLARNMRLTCEAHFQIAIYTNPQNDSKVIAEILPQPTDLPPCCEQHDNRSMDLMLYW